VKKSPWDGHFFAIENFRSRHRRADGARSIAAARRVVAPFGAKISSKNFFSQNRIK